MPLQDQNAPITGQIVAAIQLVLRQRGFRAGRFALGYQSCDDAPVPFSDTAVAAKCAANAQGYARDRSVIGVIGPYASTCTANEIGVLNRAPGGPVAIANATSTYVGLTQHGTGVAPGEPDRYYPTGQRNFARVIAADNVQAAADALVARGLGVRRLFLLNDGSNYGAGLAADAAHSARKLGITISGSTEWVYAPRYVRLARRIAHAHADGVLLAGDLFDNGAQLIDDLVGVLGTRVHLLAPDAFYVPTLVQQAGLRAEGMTVSVAGAPLTALPKEGQRFVAHLREALHQEPHPFAVYAAQATEVLLRRDRPVRRNAGVGQPRTSAHPRARRRPRRLRDHAARRHDCRRGDDLPGRAQHAAPVRRDHPARPARRGRLTTAQLTLPAPGRRCQRARQHQWATTTPPSDQHQSRAAAHPDAGPPAEAGERRASVSVERERRSRRTTSRRGGRDFCFSTKAALCAASTMLTAHPAGGHAITGFSPRFAQQPM